ncbi:MAG: hypothetical protein JWN30_1069 [Bacilli bacterium]|nr:hypothetical protein [Bacilli bacterium]
MSNAAFMANEAIFNLLLEKFISSNPNDFRGNKSIPEIGTEFVFELNGAPVTDLSAQANGGNISLRFDHVQLQVFDYQDGKRHSLQNTFTVHLLMTGHVLLNGQNVSLTGLSASASGTDRLDAKAAKMVNETIIPQFQQKVAQIQLPDFSKLVDMSFQLNAIEVNDHRLTVLAQIGNTKGDPNFNVSLPAEPAIIAAIGSSVINEFAAAQFPGASASVGDKSSSWGFGYEGHAEAGADQPHVEIVNGQAQGTLPVWVSAKGGIEVLGQWIERDISVSLNTPPLNIRLVNDSNAKSVFIKVYLDGNISVDFGLPDALEKAAEGILSFIQPIASAITDAINVGLDKINIKAFTLPSTIPGTNFAANLSFGWVGFSGNCVAATILINQ